MLEDEKRKLLNVFNGLILLLGEPHILFLILKTFTMLHTTNSVSAEVPTRVPMDDRDRKILATEFLKVKYIITQAIYLVKNR